MQAMLWITTVTFTSALNMQLTSVPAKRRKTSNQNNTGSQMPVNTLTNRHDSDSWAIVIFFRGEGWEILRVPVVVRDAALTLTKGLYA